MAPKPFASLLLQCVATLVLVLLVIAVQRFLCLLSKLNFVVGMYVLEKNIVYIGFGTIQGFRHLLGILGRIARGWGGGGTTVRKSTDQSQQSLMFKKL